MAELRLSQRRWRVGLGEGLSRLSPDREHGAMLLRSAVECILQFASRCNFVFRRHSDHGRSHLKANRLSVRWRLLAIGSKRLRPLRTDAAPNL